MVGVLVIPQSLGYAALAGLPPVIGLYTAIIPALVYAYFGTSSLLAVGPVAITAIMTASSLSAYASGSLQYIGLASLMSVIVGLLLCVARFLRLGWIVQFVSRGVAQGFVSGAALLIIAGQLKYLIGIPMAGDTLGKMFFGLMSHADTVPFVHLPTAVLGVSVFILFIINRYRAAWLWGWLPARMATLARQGLPLMVALLTIWASRSFEWQQLGIRTLAPLPSGLLTPNTALLATPISDVMTLLPSASLMALIVFVSSIAVAQNLSTLQSPISANKELTALGLSNIASGAFGGFAVAGGLSRTGLNVSVGVTSKFAGAVAGVTVLLILWLAGDVLTGLPYAVLGAIIASSVLSMIDVATLRQAWISDKADAAAFVVSFVATCTLGLNIGLVAGLLTAFAGLIYKSHQVHVAVVGQVAGSEHFRNIHRHDVLTFCDVLLIRIDESLYFGNAQVVQDTLTKLCHQYHDAAHVVLIMTAVNRIDLTAQTMLSEFNHALVRQGKTLHYAEIKGPVMDTIKDTNMIQALSGKVYLSTKMAVDELCVSQKIN